MSSEAICKLLQDEICICNDPEVRALCENYCEGKCDGQKHTGTPCVPAVSLYFIYFVLSVTGTIFVSNGDFLAAIKKKNAFYFMYIRSTM